MSPRTLLAACLVLPAVAVAQPPLRDFDAASPARIRAAHAGRPFVLSFWSIHCAPCIEEMPVWRALAARHPGVPVILVSTDPPAERERVREYLRRHDPGAVQRWQYADDFDERIRHAIDPKWRGELPRTYFHDAAHRAEATTGVVTRVQAERWFAERARKH